MLSGAPLPADRHATLNAAFRDAAASPHGLAFVGMDEHETVFSWAELHARAQKTAAGLARDGVRPGDRVALILPTSVDFVDAFFGTLLSGAIPVPLYPPVRLEHLEE